MASISCLPWYRRHPAATSQPLCTKDRVLEVGMESVLRAAADTGERHQGKQWRFDKYTHSHSLLVKPTRERAIRLPWSLAVIST